MPAIPGQVEVTAFIDELAIPVENLQIIKPEIADDRYAEPVIDTIDIGRKFNGNGKQGIVKYFNAYDGLTATARTGCISDIYLAIGRHTLQYETTRIVTGDQCAGSAVIHFITGIAVIQWRYACVGIAFDADG